MTSFECGVIGVDPKTMHSNRVLLTEEIVKHSLTPTVAYYKIENVGIATRKDMARDVDNEYDRYHAQLLDAGNPLHDQIFLRGTWQRIMYENEEIVARAAAEQTIKRLLTDAISSAHCKTKLIRLRSHT
ncbi:hypothetical protein RB195_013092 [Necator americanus]|uniref:Uncharacterized protein n=1 Tax=Necator americanus TaxID=51031 RepID=A0ABR1DU22_NECAM